MADLEKAVLAAVDKHGQIADSTRFAEEQGVEHLKLVGVIKSLEASEMITVKVRHCCKSPSRALTPLRVA